LTQSPHQPDVFYSAFVQLLFFGFSIWRLHRVDFCSSHKQADTVHTFDNLCNLDQKLLSSMTPNNKQQFFLNSSSFFGGHSFLNANRKCNPVFIFFSAFGRHKTCLPPGRLLGSTQIFYRKEKNIKCIRFL
jgi:hypothetical protein